MLHAQLHRKLDESIPEPQRLEDALTSTVFGTLVLVDAWDVLARWLSVDSMPPMSELAMPVGECWFWPRMALRTEPDVIMRLGDVLVVVEAKYRSGRHDLAPAGDAEEDLCDQLLRQHQCVMTPPESRPRYAEPIELAIKECRLVQAFVVDARRQRRARREYKESKQRLPPGACLELITWQRLFRLLNDPALASRRWAADLRAYLELCGLDTFEGIGRGIAVSDLMRQVLDWRGKRAGSGFRAVIKMLDGAPVGALQRWRPLAGPAAGKGVLHTIDAQVIDGSAPRTILLWGVHQRIASPSLAQFIDAKSEE